MTTTFDETYLFLSTSRLKLKGPSRSLGLTIMNIYELFHSDANTLIESIPFTSIGKMQPFLVSVSSSTILVMDFHCHLTNNEVCGYLGGTWDINAHNLSITHAFPCRNSRFDRDKAAMCELQIQKLMVKKNLNLVGWYHSHPRFPVQPTLRDCDAQLEYQIKMRGPTEASYIPCVGFICCEYSAKLKVSFG